MRTRWKSWIITDYESRLLSNITPGEILDEEFLEPMAITQYRLAKDIGVPPRRINEIVKGRRATTAPISPAER